MSSRPFHACTAAMLLSLALAISCGRSGEGEIEVEVKRVALDPGSQSPVILLEDKEHKVALPIWIGPAEAQAIAMELQGIAPPRPMTHDLMKNMLEEMGVGLKKVVILDLRDNTYYARIVLEGSGEHVEIDSRPSDAIALAVRFRQPIFVAAGVLSAANTIDLQTASPARSLTLAGLTVQELSQDLALHFALPPGQGVLVSNVVGNAGEGLRRGDVIMEVDGVPVRSLDEFERTIRSSGRKRFSVRRGEDRFDVSFDSRGP